MVESVRKKEKTGSLRDLNAGDLNASDLNVQKDHFYT